MMSVIVKGVSAVPCRTQLMAAYRDHRDSISVARTARQQSVVNVAIEMLDDINHFLRQAVGQPSSYQATCEALLKLHQQYTLRCAASGRHSPGANSPATSSPAAAPTPASRPTASA